MADHHLDENDASLSKGFNQGHFARSLLNIPTLDEAWAWRRSIEKNDLIRVGFVLGFYSCMQIDDIPNCNFAEWMRAQETAKPYIHLLISAVPPDTCNPNTIKSMLNWSNDNWPNASEN